MPDTLDDYVADDNSVRVSAATENALSQAFRSAGAAWTDVLIRAGERGARVAGSRARFGTVAIAVVVLAGGARKRNGADADAATELAQHLPLTIVSEQVGLPDYGRENMLKWAAATFDMIGPDNQRGRDAWIVAQEMRAYVATLTTRESVKPQSWAARLLDQVDQGTIRADQYPALLRDYLGPALDTTIFATSSLIWLFGNNPEQWAILREDSSLARNAINEAVRIESPIRGFTRYAKTDHDIDRVTVPAGSRVLLLYASANRDERKWHEPDRFDIRRKVGDHVGFGFGVHSCAGMHLARLEIECLLDALIPRVRHFEIGEPVRAINNTLRGFASLPVRVHR